MTVTAFASFKGSPGVTTLACLVAAKWPHSPAPIVAECDPAGGDLAARFELSSRCGWPSFATSLRREGRRAALDPHLQQLASGLDVLVGTEPAESSDHSAISGLLDSAKDGARDVLVDLGRLPTTEDECASYWLGGSDEIVLVAKADAPSLIAVRLRSTSLTERYGAKLGLVVVGTHHRTDEEIEAFTGIRLLSRISSDPGAAAVASGGRRGRRRLSRSGLVASAARLALELARMSSAAAGCSEWDGQPVVADHMIRSAR